MAFNQNSGTAVPTLINSSQVLLTGNAASANALTVRQFGAGNVFSAQTTSGTTALFVAGSGNVGVGTTSPVAPLSTFFGTAGIPNTTGSGTSNVATRFQVGSVCLDMGNISNGNMWLQNHLDTNWATNYPLLLNPNGGNVGIGTTSPGSLFTVYGNNAISGSIALTGPTEGSPSYIYKGLAVPAGNTGTRPYLGLTATNSTAQSNIFLWGDQNNIGPVISMSTTQYQFWNSAQTSQYMTILSSGNVGIGTTSPGYKLSVQTGGYTTSLGTNIINSGASGSTTANIALSDYITYYKTNPETEITSYNLVGGYQYIPLRLSGNPVTVTTGNVGIGTTNPGQALQVVGNMQMGSSSGDYRQFILGGGNSSGYLYGCFAKYGDAIHMGYNFYNNNTTNVIPNVGGATSRISMGYGTVSIHTGGINAEPTNLGYYQDSTGKVGIGTASPSNKLSVNSSTAILTSQVQVSHGVGDWGIVVKRNAADAGSSNFAFLKSRDEAGTTPIVQGDNIGRIAWHAVTNGTGPVFQHLAEIGCVNTTFSGGNADGSLLFWTKQTTDASTVERVRILANGNVGIGTTSPSGTLDVRGTSMYVGNQVNSAAASGATSNANIVLSGAGNNPITGSLPSIYHRGYVGLGLCADYAISFEVNANTSRADAMRITATGLVGIGTTNPAYSLDIGQFAASTYTLRLAAASTASGTMGTSIRMMEANDTYGFSFQNLSGSRFGIFRHSASSAGSEIISILRDNPYVGIGTTNPQNTLHVSGGRTRLVAGSETYAVGVSYSEASGGFYYIGATNSATPDMVFSQVGGSERMRITNAGNVGIGITNPSFKLQVKEGDSSFAYFGPNTTWGASLKVGAGSSYSASGVASVVASDGNLHIDAANNAKNIYLNYFQGGGSGGVNSTVLCYAAFTATGDITAFSSDERLKTKVGLIENALDKVCSLTAFKYTHNETARKNGFTDDNVYVGLSAQEVQKVLPEVVKPAPFDQGTEYDVGKGKSRSGENYLTVQYERIVSLLVEALKEERAERLKVDERLARLEKLLLKE